MNIFEANLRKLDHFQQGRRSLAFVFGLIKGNSDIRGGNLIVQLTYSMFTTVFPLLLLLVTVLTFILAGDSMLKQHILKTTFAEFPLVASQLGKNIHVLRRDSEIALVVGFLGLIYGATGLAGTGIYVMQQVWEIKASKRLNYIKRLGRGFVFLMVLGFGVALTTLLSGFGTYSRHNLVLTIIFEILAILLNIGIYLAAFRTLTPKQVITHDLVPGAIFGGIAWTILQALGGYVVGHYLKNDNATFGVFGSVLGLIAWLYLGAEITLYAAITNKVKKYHLWPRSLFEPAKPD